MALFTLPCRDCGAPVEIPGRLGFKLKNAGVSTSVCQRCRQDSFQATASLAASLVPRNNRLIPAAAVLIACLIVATGSLLIRDPRPQLPNPVQTTD